MRPSESPPKSMQATSASVRLDKEVLVDAPAPLLPPLSDPSLQPQKQSLCVSSLHPNFADGLVVMKLLSDHWLILVNAGME